MFEAGIVDPAKVTRSALQNAPSVAAMFLTTEAVIADKPEPENQLCRYGRHGWNGRHDVTIGPKACHINEKETPRVSFLV